MDLTQIISTLAVATLSIACALTIMSTATMLYTNLRKYFDTRRQANDDEPEPTYSHEEVHDIVMNRHDLFFARTDFLLRLVTSDTLDGAPNPYKGDAMAVVKLGSQVEEAYAANAECDCVKCMTKYVSSLPDEWGLDNPSDKPSAVHH